jgi:ribbon-helix-helix CopG family protein
MPNLAPFLHQKPRNLTEEAFVKFFLPRRVKAQLQELAEARSLSLSALLRLIVTEYIKNKR